MGTLGKLTRPPVDTSEKVVDSKEPMCVVKVKNSLPGCLIFMT